MKFISKKTKRFVAKKIVKSFVKEQVKSIVKDDATKLIRGTIHTSASYLGNKLVPTIRCKIDSNVSNTLLKNIASVHNIHCNDNMDIYSLSKKYKGLNSCPPSIVQVDKCTFCFIVLENNFKLKNRSDQPINADVADEDDVPNKSSGPLLSIYLFGVHSLRCYKEIINFVESTKNLDHINIVNLFRSNDRDKYPETGSDIIKIKSAKTFNELLLSKEAEDKLLSTMSIWFKSKDWYAKNKLVHKVGILLYGKPGVGKSSLITAVAERFDINCIFYLSPSALDCEASCINAVINDYINRKEEKEKIIVLEDIDIIFEERKKSPARLHNLLQMLDGIDSLSNTIYIATTNYIDRLDSALIRAGRFDVRIEIPEFDKSDAKKFVNMFGYDESILSKLDINEYPVQPALLQSKIMEYRSKELYSE
jgi:GTP-binding protein EngB required for normal cell division